MVSISSPQPVTNVAEIAAAPAATRLAALLTQAIAQVKALGADFAADSHPLETLLDRLAEERFHLAVLGQFKRGKSTLLNALVGEPLLPTSVVPLTATPTFIRAGITPGARVIYQNGRPADTFPVEQTADLTALLARFVTEAGNPHNHRGVSHVEVFHPAPLLRQGVVLVDTPGIGSTLRHNTEATLNFLPQCDAALFLVSADPPVTEVEIAFLQEVQTKVARIFFILNKVDYLDQTDRQLAVQFFENVLREQAGLAGSPLIFPVSARQGLQARQTGDASLWAQSGLAEVESRLQQFLKSEKREVLQTALARQAGDHLATALLKAQLTLRSLQLPLDVLAERRRLFEQTLAGAEQQRLAAGDLLAGDEKRMVAWLEEQAEQLRQKARRYLQTVVEPVLAAGTAGAIEPAAQAALAEAIPGFFERELGELSRTFDQQVAAVLQPHHQRAGDLIETVRRSAAELFELDYQAVAAAGALIMSQPPYWVTHQWRSTLSPFSPGLVDKLLPARYRQARVRQRLLAQIDRLVMRNVENLRWATLQSLQQTFRRFGLTLDERLRETIAATHGAIEQTYTHRQAHQAAVAGTVAHLEASIAALEATRLKIRAFANSA